MSDQMPRGLELGSRSLPPQYANEQTRRRTQDTKDDREAETTGKIGTAPSPRKIFSESW
jgi:hypothetical protein